MLTLAKILKEITIVDSSSKQGFIHFFQLKSEQMVLSNASKWFTLCLKMHFFLQVVFTLYIDTDFKY